MEWCDELSLEHKVVYHQELLDRLRVYSEALIGLKFPPQDQITPANKKAVTLMIEDTVKKAELELWACWDPRSLEDRKAEYALWADANLPKQKTAKQIRQELRASEPSSSSRAGPSSPAVGFKPVPKSKWSGAAHKLWQKTNLEEKEVCKLEGFLGQYDMSCDSILAHGQEEVIIATSGGSNDAELAKTKAALNDLLLKYNRLKTCGQMCLSLMEQGGTRLQWTWCQDFGYTPSAPVAGMPTPNQSHYAFSDAAMDNATGALSGGVLLDSSDVGRMLRDSSLDPQTHAWHLDGFPISRCPLPGAVQEASFRDRPQPNSANGF